MKVSQLIDKLNLKTAAGADGAERQASGCYIGDLLSLAMARLKKGNVWITIQTNVNIAAVASLTEAACIILPEELLPDENAKAKADMEEIPILSSSMTAYELAYKLRELGI